MLNTGPERLVNHHPSTQRKTFPLTDLLAATNTPPGQIRGGGGTRSKPTPVPNAHQTTGITLISCREERSNSANNKQISAVKVSKFAPGQDASSNTKSAKKRSIMPERQAKTRRDTRTKNTFNARSR